MRYNIAMSTARPFSTAEFVQKEREWLELAHEGDIDPVDATELRAWLEQTPGRLNQTSLTAWVEMTGLLLWKTHGNEQATPSDGELLRSVLDHALTIPMHVWMAEGKPLVASKPNPHHVPSEDDEEDHETRPAYDALRGVMGMLSLAETGQGPHPTMMAALALGWQPGPLLHHLDQAREIQAVYVETEYTPKTDTAQGFLVSAVLAAMGSSPWVPQAHPCLAMLWDKNVHNYYQRDTSHDGIGRRTNKERSQAAKTAFDAFPQYAGQALLAYLNWNDLRHSLRSDQMFPFPFKESHGTQTLEALVRSWQQQHHSMRVSAKAVCKQIEHHHASLAHLLEVHCSFYSQPEHAIQNLSDLMESFHVVIGKEHMQTLSIAHLDLGA